MPLPRIAPLRPVRSKTVPLGREWIYELKLDGFRGVLAIENGRGKFTSKNEKPLKRFDDLANAIARAMPVKNAIFDGEIVVMGDNGPDFYALFFRRGVPAYAAFDILWLDGRDLRAQPLWRRKRTLARILESSPIGLVDHVDDPALYAVTAARDLEGIVAKRRTDAYDLAARWVKVKHPGYSQMEGRWELFDRR